MSRNKIPFSQKEINLFLGIIFIIVAFLFGILTTTYIKKKIIHPEKIYLSKGSIGSTQYLVHIVSDGIELDPDEYIVPSQSCRELMVVDVRNLILKTEELKQMIIVIPGVFRVHVGRYRIVIEKPCPAGSDPHVFWTWDSVFKNIKPTLENFFTQP